MKKPNRIYPLTCNFDRNFEIEYHLRAKGKDEEIDDVVELADMADIHYVR